MQNRCNLYERRDFESGLVERCRHAGIAYVPGAAFYAHQPDARTLRLSFVTLTPDLIKEGVETRIACDHNGGYSKYSGIYHYRVVLPKGYHADATKTWPVIFIASPAKSPTSQPVANN